MKAERSRAAALEALLEEERASHKVVFFWGFGNGEVFGIFIGLGTVKSQGGFFFRFGIGQSQFEMLSSPLECSLDWFGFALALTGHMWGCWPLEYSLK